MEMGVDNKIKILRVVSRMNIGGPSIHVSLLSRCLNHRRFNSMLVVGSISAEEGDMNYLLEDFQKDRLYKIKELQREIDPWKDLISLIKLIKIVIREKPDIVHTHMAKAGVLARLAVLICNLINEKKIRIVHTYHGNVLGGYFGIAKSKFFTWIEKIFATFSDAIVAISPTQQWELSEKFRISSASKIFIINLGFSLLKFINGSSRKGEFRKKIGVSENAILIGIVGRLVPIKNHRVFIDAAKLLLETIDNPILKFVIIGDGELRSLLENYARLEEMQEHIIFHGWEKDIDIVYADLDILALTSLNEGTPVSIIEAMASSVPVVSTGVGGIKDLLGRFISSSEEIEGYRVCERGILCQTNNAMALSNGIQYLIRNGLDKTSDKIADACRFVVDNYSDKALLNNIEKLYCQLLGR